MTKINQMKKITKKASYVLMFLTTLFFLLWLLLDYFHLLIWSLTLLIMHNIVFAFRNIRNRIYFLLFNLTTFLFLSSRPFIDMIYGYDLYAYDEQTGSFALLLIGCSLLCLLAGVLISENFSKNKQYENPLFEEDIDPIFIKDIQKASLIIYFICLFFNYVEGTEKIIFSRSHTYFEYYTTYKTRLSFVVRGIGDLMPASLVIYLMTMPSKRKAMVPLTLYLISTIPDLVVGSRSSISKALIFVFLYFFLRDTINKKCFEHSEAKCEKWITKRQKRIAIIIIPLMVIFFSSYNYTRFGFKKTNDMNPIVDFVYNQGISFTVITRGYTEAPKLPNHEEKNYTFGPIIDYVTRGAPAQILFGAKSLGARNSIARAIEGNSFSHALSYHLYGAKYLRGTGSGSSYLIELYVDYGFLGVIIFSLLLGVFLSSINDIIGKSWLSDVMISLTLMEIFVIPRGRALGWFLTFVTPQFWGLMVLWWFTRKLILNKKKICKIWNNDLVLYKKIWFVFTCLFTKNSKL